MSKKLPSILLCILPIFHFIMLFLFGYYNATHDSRILSGLGTFIGLIFIACWLYGILYVSSGKILCISCGVIACISFVYMACLPLIIKPMTREFNHTFLTSIINLNYIYCWLFIAPVTLLFYKFKRRFTTLSNTSYLILSTIIIAIVILTLLFFTYYNASKAILTFKYSDTFVIVFMGLSFVGFCLWGCISFMHIKSKDVWCSFLIQSVLLLIAYSFQSYFALPIVFQYMIFSLFCMTLIHQFLPPVTNKIHTFI